MLCGKHIPFMTLLLGRISFSQSFVPSIPRKTLSNTKSLVINLKYPLSKRAMSNDSGSLMDAMSTAVSKALDRKVELKPTSGGGASGGGGASVSAVMDPETNTKYFIKAAPISSGGGKMLYAEYTGVKEMAKTESIKVPNPIAYGEGGPSNTAFVVFEYLDFEYGGSGYELGKQLAQMHRSTSEKGFGFELDNTIGATPQPNLPYYKDWSEFWDVHRLGHMLKLCQNVGYSNDKIEQLREKTKELLSHNPSPSLLHGDLWGGNKGYAKVGDDVVPVIFDPATYYGDREADVAMTYLFGGFGTDFYQGYEDEWSLPEGHEKRVTVYNLYHILNHVSQTFLFQIKNILV